MAVLLSGGVDSSLALTLLKAAGHDVHAFYLQIWFQEDFRNFWDSCPWEEDLDYAQKVCLTDTYEPCHRDCITQLAHNIPCKTSMHSHQRSKFCTGSSKRTPLILFSGMRSTMTQHARMQVCDQLGVPLTTVPLTKQYWDRVVSHCVEQIHSGRTPNPDVLCNSRVKFGAFFEYLQRHPAQFDRVASGHYACVSSEPNLNDQSSVETNPGHVDGTLHSGSTTAIDRRAMPDSVRLRLTPDSWKDQTYFLANLSQQQLQQLLFPLGHLTKKKVREIATAAQLPTMARKDSQGICFLGKVKFSEFIKVCFYFLIDTYGATSLAYRY